MSNRKPLFFFTLILFSALFLETSMGQVLPLSGADLNSLTSGPDLSIGQKSGLVSTLQTFLSRQGKVIYPEQIVSGYFGILTRSALSRFQKENGIAPALGYFGPITKKYLASHISLYLLNTTNQSSSSSSLNQSSTSSITPQPVLQITSSTTVPSIDSGINVLVSDNGINSNVDYANMLIDISKNIKLTDEDLNNTKKINSIPLALPGLMDWAISKKQITDQDLKNTAIFWEKITNQTQLALEQKTVSPAMESYHKTMIGWFKYNYQVATKMESLKISDPSLQSLLDQYKLTYQKYGPALNKKLQLSDMEKIQVGIGWRSFLSDLGIFKVAQAAGGIPFGGIITISDICLTGELLVVSAPAPGAFFLYWPIYFTNPFLYNAVITGNWILGEALPGPGICSKTLINYTEGEGVILYFGTGLQ